MAGTIRLETEDRVVTLWIDRPPLNVLDLATLRRLEQALADVAALEGLQMVVLRGSGGRAFSAGVAVEDHVGERIPAMLETFHGALRRLLALEPVTVAAVDGHCLGGGMELAAVCDLVVATDRSTFGQPEIKLGCFPPVAAVLFPSLFGSGRAFDLLLTGRTIDCRQAEGLGFVTRRTEGELDAAVEGLRRELTAHSAAALRLAKKAIRLGEPRVQPLERALTAAERIYLDELAATADMEEGVAAFMEKRPPVWSHGES